MAVLVEAISVIVRRSTINEKYPDGWNGYLRDAPNQTLCADSHLARLGFMTPIDCQAFVNHLQSYGFLYLNEGDCVDLAVIDQKRGFTAKCGWLEFGRIHLDSDGEVAVCRLKGDTTDSLITPDGWSYEDSLSAQDSFVPSVQIKDRLRFLRHKDGLDIYQDLKTGREVYLGRTGRPQPQPSRMAATGSGTAANGLLDPLELAGFVRRWRELLATIGPFPDEFEGKTENPHEVSAFDVNRYLEAFDRIRIMDGYVLDYIYSYDGRGGIPRLYARERGEPPIKSAQEYYDRFKGTKKEIILGDEPQAADLVPFTDYLTFEDSSLGYLQFSLFLMTAHRFYLFWHAIYHERDFILSTEDLQCSIDSLKNDLTTQEKQRLLSVDIRPRVFVRGEAGEVILFNREAEKGYTFLHINLRRPNTCLGYHDEVIVEKNMQVLF